MPSGALVRGIMVATLAYVSLVPFYYLQPLYLGPDLPPLSVPRGIPLAAGILLLLIVGADLVRRRIQLTRTVVDWPVAAVLAAGLASLPQAAHPVVGMVKWCYYLVTGAALSFVLVHYLPEAAAVVGFVRRLGLAFGAMVVYTLASYLLGYDYLWGAVQSRNNPYYVGTAYRATGPFGNPISTGAYLVLCVPVLVWLSRYAGKQSARLAYGALAAVAVYLGVMTQSRGAWLGFVGAGLGLSGYTLYRGLRLLRKSESVALAMLVVLGWPVAVTVAKEAGLTAALQTEVAKVSDRASLLAPVPLVRTERYRLAQYRTTANVLAVHPLLGVGIGNFTRVYDSYRDPSTPAVAEFPARTTENMYLMFTAETGLAGLLCNVWLFGAIGCYGVRLHQRLPRGMERGLALAATTAIGGFLLNMLTWDALYDPTIRLLLWSVVGALLALGRTSVPAATAANH